MKKYNILIASLMFTFCCLLVSCDNDKEILPVPATPELLELQTSIEGTTRSGIKEHFTAGDKLGLILTRDNSESIYKNDLTNGIHLFSTYSVNNKWEQTVYLADENANVYAYFPGSLSIPDAQKPVVSFNQRAQKDILYGTHSPNTTQYVNRTSNVATLKLQHATAVVEFLIRKDNYHGAGKLTKVEIANNAQTANPVLMENISLNVVTGAVEGSESNTSILLEKGDEALQTIATNYPTAGIEAFAVLIDKVKTAGDLLTTFTIDNRSYVWNVPVNTMWDAGYKYIYNITIKGTELVLETVTIEEYESGESKDITIY